MPAAARLKKIAHLGTSLMALGLPYLIWAQEAVHEAIPEAIHEALPESTTAACLDTSFDFWPIFFNMLLMLVGILGLLLGASWALKRVMTQRLNLANSTHRIEILERRGLHSKACLYLLRVGDEEILAAESSDGLRTLAHWKKSHSHSNPS